MHQIDFGHGSVLKNVLRSAGPMMAAQILSLLYNIVDRIYIGRIPGAGVAALGGVGICFPLITIVTAFANLFGSGGAPLCSIAYGRGDTREASRVLNASFFLLLISSLMLTGLFLLFCQPILSLFGASSTNMTYALDYMQIYLLGTLFSMVSLGLNPFITAQGFPGIGMMTILVGASVNIALDPLLIFTFDMGVAGAAAASVLSQLISMLYVLWFLTSRKAVLRLDFHCWKQAMTVARIRSIVSLGLAAFIMQITNSLVQILSNNMLRQYGGDLYISVMTIVSSVRQILDTPIFGLADGAGPIISFSYGAGKYNRLKEAIRVLTVLALGYTTLVWLLIVLVPGFFIDLFNSDPNLKAAALPALSLYFFAFVFQALQYAGQTTFKSLNKKKQAIFFSLFRKVLIVVPLTLWLPTILHPAVSGVFLAEPISNFVGGSICFATMYWTIYRRLPKTDGSSAQDA